MDIFLQAAIEEARQGLAEGGMQGTMGTPILKNQFGDTAEVFGAAWIGACR